MKKQGAPFDVRAWTEAGLAQLADQGIDGVRVESLARRLGVTKGSFYWHFADRDALLEAMLAHWRKRATLDIIDRIDRAAPTPQERVRHLLRLPIVAPASSGGAAVELAIRIWGRRDPRALATLEEVDALRLRYLARLVEQCGVPPDESFARAVLAYAYMRVAATLIGREQAELMRQCEDHLLRA